MNSKEEQNQSSEFQKFREDLIHLITEDKLLEVFDKLREYHRGNVPSEVITLEGRFVRLKHKKRVGIISEGDATLEINRIRYALTEYVMELEESPSEELFKKYFNGKYYRNKRVFIFLFLFVLVTLTVYYIDYNKELEIKNTLNTENFIDEFSNKILALDYQGANFLLRKTLIEKGDKKTIKRAASELIFWYTKTGKYKASFSIIDKLGHIFKETTAFNTTKDTLTYLNGFLYRSVEPSLLQELNDKYYPKLIYVPRGSFIMGSAEIGKMKIHDGDSVLEHRVKVSSFYICETEITVWQYNIYCISEGLILPTHHKGNGKGNRPIVYVSWEDAQDYAEWLSKVKNRTYKLPTEAQWEFAAGGGLKGRDQDGNRLMRYSGSNTLDSVGFYLKNSGGSIQEVKLKKGNQLGLYDMSGNVGEWCQDWYDPSYYNECELQGEVLDPSGPTKPHPEDLRTLRGGGAQKGYGREEYARVACRGFQEDTHRASDVGFRLVSP